MDAVISLVSAAIAISSAVVSAYFSRRSVALTTASQWHGYIEHVRDWADETIDVTVEIVRRLERWQDQSLTQDRLAELQVCLSAQIDKGRLFFPNVDADLYDGPVAFKGLRPPPLDRLVGIFNAVDNLEWERKEPTIAAILESHRYFITDVQHMIDPGSRASPPAL